MHRVADTQCTHAHWEFRSFKADLANRNQLVTLATTTTTPPPRNNSTPRGNNNPNQNLNIPEGVDPPPDLQQVQCKF